MRNFNAKTLGMTIVSESLAYTEISLQTNSKMRIANLADEFHLVEEIFLNVDLSGDGHWIGEFLQQRHSLKNRTKTVLVTLQEVSVFGVVLVEYFASGNYGFVKLLTLNDRLQEGNECRLQLNLTKEAISVANKVSFHIDRVHIVTYGS